MVHVVDNENGINLQVHYESLSEAVQDLDNRNMRDRVNDGELKTWDRPEGKPWGGADWSNAANPAWLKRQVGSPAQDVLAVIDRMRASLAESPSVNFTAPRRKRLRGQDFGDEMNADRFLAKDPLLWERMDKARLPRRTIVVLNQASINSMGRREDLIPRGAAIAALCDWLTVNGYNVEVLNAFLSVGVTHSSYGVMTLIKVKSSLMPLDMAAMVPSLCEVAFVRGTMLRPFPLYALGRVNSSYGYPQDLNEAQLKALKVDVTIGQSVRTEAQGLEWLKAQVEKLSAEQVAA